MAPEATNTATSNLRPQECVVKRIPAKYDWGELKRVLCYVQQKINLPIILREESLTVIKWQVDASYETPRHERSHGILHVVW